MMRRCVRHGCGHLYADHVPELNPGHRACVNEGCRCADLIKPGADAAVHIMSPSGRSEFLEVSRDGALNYLAQGGNSPAQLRATLEGLYSAALRRALVDDDPANDPVGTVRLYCPETGEYALRWCSPIDRDEELPWLILDSEGPQKLSNTSLIGRERVSMEQAMTSLNPPAPIEPLVTPEEWAGDSPDWTI